jgi:predicted ATPase
MPVKIESIKIERMRRFQRDLTLNIGEGITLVAGENATSKSTLLGMLCQPFHFGNLKLDKKPVYSVYTENYNGMRLNQYTTIPGKLFKSEYREVFRMSKAFDNPTTENPYVWRLQLSGDAIIHEKVKKDGLYVRSRHREEGHAIRFVTGPGDSHEKGEGNFPHPVIYLGLNRLAPLALCRNVQVDTPKNLNTGEQQWIANQYRTILVLPQENISAQYIHNNDKTKGDSLGPKGDFYDAESCSAGQDNIGQILTAILSFKRLRNEIRDDKFLGGLLLIDEIDATLHPLAQENLIKLLVKECKELKLQIIATTHSQYLLKLAMTEMRNMLHLVFLENKGGTVIQDNITSYQQIEDKLQQRIRPHTKGKTKPTVLLEDGAAKDFLSYLVGSRAVSCFPVGTAGTIINMSGMNIPELVRTIFVIDGDQASSVKRQSRLIALPGNVYPEKMVFDYLFSLPETDTFFSDLPQRSLFRAHGSGQLNKRKYKAWYNHHRQYFVTNAKNVFARWGKDNSDAIEDFLNRFEKIMKKTMSI